LKFSNLFKKTKEPNILSGHGLLDYIRSNISNPTDKNVLKALDAIAMPDDDLEHLTAEGDLHWGWHRQNKEFTDKINAEYTHFLNTWLNSRNKSPKEQYSALKSFVIYLEDVEKLCKYKGECFEFWFYEILTAPDYLKKRKAELQELQENLESLQATYTTKQNNLNGMEEKTVQLLKQNDGIIQAEFIKLFDVSVKDDLSKTLYYWEKEGKIERIKSGRSYILHYKGDDA